MGKPIVLLSNNGKGERIVIERNGEPGIHRPYLTVTADPGDIYGFVDDKDVKLLKQWCEECLAAKARQELQTKENK